MCEKCDQELLLARQQDERAKTGAVIFREAHLEAAAAHRARYAALQREHQTRDAALR